jgi:hypothetical protein
MVIVALYIYDDASGLVNRVELFNDEKISVTSSVQDVNDISKIYTDFSQSFTVPASPHNNSIFKHWYENSIDGGFDARTRKNAFIELDTISFRKGKIQLEKVSYKKGYPDNYQLTFFGSLISLKDAFGGKFLKDLDLSTYNFSYTGTVVKNRVIGGAGNDVMFPLISSLNVWTYNTNGTTKDNWDIKKNTNPIYYSDLFPAIRVSKVFDAIATSLGVTFTGDFLSDSRFTRAFLWLKNSEAFQLKTVANKLNFQTNTSTTGTQGIFNVFSDTLNYVKPTAPEYQAQSNITITFSVPSVGQDAQLFYFYLYKDGVVINTQSYLTQTSPMYLELPLEESGAYTFYIASTAAISFTSVYYYETGRLDGSTYTKMTDLTVTQSTTQTTTTTMDLAQYMPEMTIEEFFSGILKMFNLTCYSEVAGVFKIEQLEDWYTNGTTRDITTYIIGDEFDIERSKAYKKVNFKYQKGESFLNEQFMSRSKVPYGDLYYELDNDGEEYTIELPFENLLHTKFTGTNMQVGYALKPSYIPYIPKPVILYDYGSTQTVSQYYFNDGSSTTNHTTANIFGQDTSISSVNYTLNFGADQSSYTGNIEEESLFKNYYSSYLDNIFSDKSRILKIKAMFPTGLLSQIKVNDRVIIRDKRYTINTFTTDLTSGEVDLELLTDFRDI